MKHLSRKLLVALLAVSVALSLCAVSVFAGQQAIGVGTVTGEVARIRSTANLSAPVSLTLDQGTNVSILGKSGDWYRVNYDSTTGYIADNCIGYATSADDLQTSGMVTADSVAVRSAASLSGSKIGSADRGMEIDITGFENGWYQVTFDNQVGYIRSDGLTLTGKPEVAETAPTLAADNATQDADAAKEAIGVINADDVRMRSDMETDAENVITALNKGDQVTILEKLKDWYKVAFDIHEGYVFSKFVTEDGSVPVSTPKKEEPAKPGSSIIAVGIVDGDGVHMRKKPNTDSGIITTLGDGTAVSILEKSSGWYKINYDGQDGYMSADYLDVKTSTSDLSTYALVKADVLNMRSKADASSGIVAGICSGEYLDVTGFENGWYLASYDDYSGYVSGDYVTLVNEKPLPEPEPVVSSSSSSGSSSSSSSSSSSGSWSLPSGGSAGSGSGTGSDIADYALQFIGVPYVYGGASPSGFDCSGFTMYVYNHFGYSLPHGASSQLRYGSEVGSMSSLQPGDIVFFHNTVSGDPDPASHVGIYIGGGEFVHASSGSAESVTISNLHSDYYYSHYLTGRHIA